MKLHWIYLLLLVTSKNVLAETNWEELQEIAKNPKYVTAINTQTRAELKLVELAKGRYRLDSFKVVPLHQMVFTYESSRELKELCRGYFENRNKKFKAKLTFSKNNEINFSSFVLENGEKLGIDMIENPFVASELKVRDLSENDQTIWIDKTLDSIKMGGNVNQYYLNLFNQHIKNSVSDVVEIDLSELNGLACDIGLGNIKPEISANLTFERALPLVSFWLKREIFAEVANHYVQIAKSAQLKKEDAKINEKNQLILGWSLALAEMSSRSVEESLLSKVLKSENRRGDLLKALVKMKEGENLEKSWRNTFEIEVPKMKLVTRLFPHISGDVEVRNID